MTPVMVLLFAAQTQMLTLEDAVKTAQTKQPTLIQAHAQTNAARSRADEAKAYLLPQVNASAGYSRSTSNFVARPGSLPKSVTGSTGTNNFETFNFWNFGITATQYIWDFGQTTDRWKATKELATAQADTERATQIQVLLNVRDAFYNARAQKALIGVAQENLQNQQLHLTQTQGFVKAGTHPEIDLAQSETDFANAQVQLINAQNNYDTAKVQLNQVMGIIGSTNYDVADQWQAPVEGEEKPAEELFAEAEKARPELVSYEEQIRAQQFTISSVRGAYWPAIGASTGVTEAGVELSNMAWNWNFGITLNWNLFNGFLTSSTVSEAQANLVSIEAQRDLLREQVQTDVVQSWLQVKAAKATIVAADKAVVNARERLKLAEGRYQQGVGNAIELGDAQVALAQAEAQLVQAQYSLSVARAALIKALGRPA